MHASNAQSQTKIVIFIYISM